MNSSNQINSSNDQASCPYAVSIFFTTAMAIISSAAFIGNILVIVSVYKAPSLRTSTNYYYVNMAVSDFLASLTTWPLYLTDEIITSSGSLIQGSLATIGCKVGVFFRLVSTTVSILSLVLIAVDRFIATVFPLKATLITRKIRAALLFATWLISIAYCFPTFYYSRVEEVGQEIFCRFSWNGLAIMIYYITGMALFNVTPFIVIIILHSRIMSVLSKRPKPEHHAGHSNCQQKRRKQNQNIMKIFKSIVAVLFTWFSLFCFYLILKLTSPELFIKDRCKWILGFAYFVFPSLSTAINPVILFAFSTNFRHSLPNLCPFSSTNVPSFRKTNSILPCREDDSLPEVNL